MTTPVNNELRRYEVKYPLGKGGFGTVYRADLLGAGGFAKPVALKLLNDDLHGMEEVAARMRDEARMLGLLRHRAIVMVDGLVMLDGRWAIVMEYVEGVDLSFVVEHEGMPVGAALEVIEEVAGALRVAWEKIGPAGHPMHLLHRDIKPANIQVTAQGEVKVLDFGIARANFGAREAKTQNVLFASRSYMAPERLDLIETHKGDVYSLGVVLYELLAGDILGPAAASERRHQQKIIEAVATLRNKGVPEIALDLLAVCLAFEPDERPTAAEVSKLARTIRREMSDIALIDWCEVEVPKLRSQPKTGDDPLSGRVLVESTDVIERSDLAPGVGFTPSGNVAHTLPVDHFNDQADAGLTGTTGSTKTGTVARAGMAGGAIFLVLMLLGGAFVVLGVGVYFAMGTDSGDAVVVDEGAATSGEQGVATEGAVAGERGRPDTGPRPEGTEEGAEVAASTDPKKVRVPRGGEAAAGTNNNNAAAAAGEEASPSTGADICGELAKLEGSAVQASLSAPQVKCLTDAARDPAAKLVDRRALGTALLVNQQAACNKGSGCSAYESWQRYYFEELDRSRVDMLLAWTVYLWKKPSHTASLLAEVLLWSERTLEKKSEWKNQDFVRNTDQVMEIRALAAYERWMKLAEADDPGLEKARGVARTAVIDWMNLRKRLGKDTSKASQLCSSVAGSAEVCGKFTDDANVRTLVTFVSMPLGATVFLDGEEIGKSPMNHEIRIGTHQIRLETPTGSHHEATIQVGPREPVRYTWKVASDEWSGAY